jgi:hypothetical protein
MSDQTQLLVTSLLDFAWNGGLLLWIAILTLKVKRLERRGK